MQVGDFNAVFSQYVTCISAVRVSTRQRSSLRIWITFTRIPYPAFYVDVNPDAGSVGNFYVMGVGVPLMSTFLLAYRWSAIYFRWFNE
jgi:hypothetical protein